MPSGPPTLTIQEAHALLNALIPQDATHKQHNRGVRNYTMAMTMLEAGLRVGELVQVRWDTLYFNFLPVTSIIISTEISKSKHSREIPVSTRLSQALTEYHRTCNTWKSDFDNPFAFTPPMTDLPLSTRQVERIISAAAQRSIGRPIHPHVLRHTFGSKLMRVTNAAVVQQLLGHEHLSSTQVYCHPNGQDLRNAIDTAERSEDEELESLLS